MQGVYPDSLVQPGPLYEARVHSHQCIGRFAFCTSQFQPLLLGIHIQLRFLHGHGCVCFY